MTQRCLGANASSTNALKFNRPDIASLCYTRFPRPCSHTAYTIPGISTTRLSPQTAARSSLTRVARTAPDIPHPSTVAPPTLLLRPPPITTPPAPTSSATAHTHPQPCSSSSPAAHTVRLSHLASAASRASLTRLTSQPSHPSSPAQST